MTLPSFRPRRPENNSLRFPLSSPGRLALLDTDLRGGADSGTFASCDLHGLAQFGPESMALPLDAALRLADQKLRGLLDLPSLKVAIVILSSPETGAVAEHHRDLLWSAFGLPIYEQRCDREGKVIARECEVHNGLHFDNVATAELPDSVEVVHERCECGLETPRLRYLRAPKVCVAAA